MTGPTVSVEGLGKRYQLGDRVHYGRVSEAVVRMAEAPLRFARRQRQTTEHPKHRWAFRDVNFAIEEGEVMGFIGPNGAGKSTLLKVLSRITEPTEGRATLRGRMGSLLEVGTGFHPELTGRENISLSGAILGMRRSEIRRKFDEIAEFAEVGDYIDTPVKRYSSGMQVRLGFAIAAHLESEILVVDEVLAVGDEAFQRRCLGKLEDVAHGGGRTVLFVSHNLQAVHGLCDRAIYLDRGQLIDVADTSSIVQRYLERSTAFANERTWGAGEQPGDDVLRLVAVRVLGCDGSPLSATRSAEPVIVELDVETLRATEVALGFDLESEDGSVVMSTFMVDGNGTGTAFVPGRNRLRAIIPGGLLNAGSFSVGPRAARFGVGQIFHQTGSVRFQVFSDEHESFFGLRRRGSVAPEITWTRLEY